MPNRNIGDAAEDVRQISRKATEDGLGKVATLILAEAIKNLPVGDPEDDPDPAVNLRNLGHIEHVHGVYHIYFEGPYAAKQHERLDYNHPRGGQAKYLEHALQTVARVAPGVVAATIRERLDENVR